MGEDRKAVLLDEGRELDVTLVKGASEFLAGLLGDAPAKRGAATLRVVKNAAGQSFVAVLLAGKYAGLLSTADAQGLVPILSAYERGGMVTQATARVAASADDPAKPVVRVSLAEPGQLLDSLRAVASAPAKEPPPSQPTPGQYCRNCGRQLPSGAKFCLECGTPVGPIPMPGGAAVLPAGVRTPVAPAVSASASQKAPRAQSSRIPPKKPGWWSRLGNLQKAGVVGGAVVVLAIIGTVAGTAGGKDAETVVSSSTSVAEVTTASSVAATLAATRELASATPEASTTSTQTLIATTTTTEAPTTTTTTTEAPTTTTQSATTTTASPSGSPLRIVSVHYDADGNDHKNLNDEYIVFEVLQSGSLQGHTVEDEANHRYHFPSQAFSAGQVFKLHTGSGTSTDTDLYWGESGTAVWNNDGDTVKVLDASGKTVTSYSY